MTSTLKNKTKFVLLVPTKFLFELKNIHDFVIKIELFEVSFEFKKNSSNTVLIILCLSIRIEHSKYFLLKFRILCIFCFRLNNSSRICFLGQLCDRKEYGRIHVLLLNKLILKCPLLCYLIYIIKIIH